MRDFFNPCVDEIIEMVKYHIREIDNYGSQVRNLFLIGGFGASKFLQEELRDTLKMRDEKELRIPEESWTAVARGAVLCGIEKDSMTNLVRTSFCTKSYGIAVDESFSYANDERDLDINPVTGKKIARNQMRWMINKGDLIMSSEPTLKEHKFVVRFKEDEPEKMKGSVQIYSWPEDKHRPMRLMNAVRGTFSSTLPTRNLSNMQLVEIDKEDLLQYDFTSCPLSDFTRRQGQDRYTHYYAVTVTLRLSISVASTRVKAELLWKNGEAVPTRGDAGFGASTGAGMGFGVHPGSSPGSSPGASDRNAEGPMSSMAAGMAGLGLGPGGAGSFGRRSDRGRLSVRDTDFHGLDRYA
jgi:hypothetical protein